MNKDIQGKPEFDLLDSEIFYGIAKVRAYGCKKYGNPDNWKTVSERHYKNALLRHVLKYCLEDEELDPESMLNHLDHAACNIMFLRSGKLPNNKKESEYDLK